MWPWNRKQKEELGKANIVTLGTEKPHRREIGFSMSKGVPIIVCTINGKGAKLLIDSGASLNVLEKSYSKRYKFTVWKKAHGQVDGIGGGMTMLGVSKVDLEIDGICTKMPFKAISFNGVQRKLGVVGVIGSKFFKDHNAVIDYETRTLSWED